MPDYQLSLAIGKEGQNARLAARLTGWRIDIKSETQAADARRRLRRPRVAAECRGGHEPRQHRAPRLAASASAASGGRSRGRAGGAPTGRPWSMRPRRAPRARRRLGRTRRSCAASRRRSHAGVSSPARSRAGRWVRKWRVGLENVDDEDRRRVRVHELAKELGVTSKELLGTLEQMGVTGKSASSSVPEDLVPRLRASGGKATTKPRQAAARSSNRRPRRASRSPRPKPKPADVVPRRRGGAGRSRPPPPRPTAIPRRPRPRTRTCATAAAAPNGRSPWRRAGGPDRGRCSWWSCAAPRRRRSPRRRPVAGRHREDPVPGRRDGHRHHLARATRRSRWSRASSATRAEIVGLEDEMQGRGRRRGRRRGQPRDRVRPWSRSWATSTTARPSCWTRSARPTWSPASSAASPSTSAPIRRTSATARSRSSTRRATRRSPRCAPAAPRSPTSPCSWWRPTTASCRRRIEALDHAKAAGVPIVVAVNKVDKEEADPNRVRTQMVEHGVVPSEWGGDYRVRRRLRARRSRTSTPCSRRSWSSPTSRSSRATRRAEPGARSSRRTSTRAAVRSRRCSCSRARSRSATRWSAARRTAGSARCRTRTARRSSTPGRPSRS